MCQADSDADEGDEKSPYGLEFFACQTGLSFAAMLAAPMLDQSNYLTVMAAISFGIGVWFWIVEHREWHAGK